MLCLFSGVAYSQSSSLVLSFDANTGTLMDDTYIGGRLNDNVFDYGVEGAHNFGKIPWLTFYGKLTLKSNISINYENANIRAGNPDQVYPKYIMNGASGFSFGFNYVEAGVRFTPTFNVLPDKLSIGLNAFVAVRHTLMLRSEVAGSFNVPFGIFVKPFFGAEVYPFYIGKIWTEIPREGTSGKKNNTGATATSVNDLYGGLQVGINFAWLGINHLDGLTVSLDASWRTSGDRLGTNVFAGGNIWKIDEADAFLYNGFVRTNFTVNYAATPRLATYLQVRYQIKNIIPLPSGTRTRFDRPNHDVYLRAGVSYRFGGAK